MSAAEPITRVVVPSHQPLRPTSPSSVAGLTLLGVLGCARRRWKQAIVLGTLFGAIAASLVWMYLPPARPFAYTKLYFATRPAGSVDHPDPPVNQATQKELITSRIVLRGVVEDPEIAALPAVQEKGDAISWLIRELVVEFPNASEIMKITLTDDRPDEARKIIDKVVQSYLAKIANEALENRGKHMKKLQDMVEVARKDLERDIDDARGSSPGGLSSTNPDVIARRQQLIVGEIQDARSELKKIASQLSTLRSDESVLTDRLKKKPLELTPGEFEPLFALNPTAVRLKQARDELVADYELKLTGLGEENPTMRALKSKITATETRLDSLRKELRTTISLQAEERLSEELRKKRDEIARMQLDEKAKTTLIQDKETEYDKMKDGTASAARSKPNFTVKGTRLEELQNKLLKLEAEIGAPIAVKQLEEEAVIVRPNDASRRVKMAGLAGIGVFGLVVCALGFLEFRAFRVGSPLDVSQALGLRLVGAVPAAPRNQLLGMGDAEWEAVLNEAVDSARTLFLHSAGLSNLRKVMVSSAVGGEGKTSLSARLAASLARSGRRTLLVDADLRNPSVHLHFKVPPGPGVAEVLRGETTVASSIVNTTKERLAVLPAGNGDRRAVEALALDGFAKLLAEADQLGYDFVLVDACPILPVADALLVGRHVDGVLLSLLVDVSQVDRVNTACQKLSAINVPLLGAVVNGVRGEAYGYGRRYVTALG